MEHKICITIECQFGSGGHEIGKKLAQKLGFAFYDEEIREEAAEECNLGLSVIETYDEIPQNAPLYTMTMGPVIGREDQCDIPIAAQVYLAEFHAIQRLAKEKSCVFVGRCANHALRDFENVLTVFVHGDLADRAIRVATRENLSTDAAKKYIKTMDARRLSYYSQNTGKKWGDPAGYHLCINSSQLGLDGTIALIQASVRHMHKE